VGLGGGVRKNLAAAMAQQWGKGSNMDYCICGSVTPVGEVCQYCKLVVPDSLEKIEMLSDFLQGHIPSGIIMSEPISCTEKQAADIIWFLQTSLFVLPDNIQKCDVCGSFYDEDSSGDCLDYGDPPYMFCDGCMDGEEYAEKQAAGKGE